ncbi:lysophospholipase [Vibrio sp. 10N.286.49.B3]|uniref:alpha/beta fold hydrolase n=1 Tax=Vibrio sp. 10N.286.49.B3 TaxID=1880855 RepID=UPI000C853663|nr:alpha/beta fold hydrolase [Vibrio sp. 10N.286.49.B3]PMH45447.1 lysophospholipase [Vibrio sp. 10N.286.49.B3]
MTSNQSVDQQREPQFIGCMENEINELWQRRHDGFITGVDKKKLYWCKLTSEQHNKAIVIVNGRVETSWKYQELFYDLFQQGFDIYSYDHRGQGRSDRIDTDMGHVEEFDDYVQDLTTLIEHFDLSHYQQRFIIGHSMGGATATRYVQTQPHNFDAIAVSAPMYGIQLDWYLRPIVGSVCHFLTKLHRKPTYAPTSKAYYIKPFENNPLTHSHVRYQWFRDLYEQHPEFKIGGPSCRWVWQSTLAIKQCLQQTHQIKIPLLLMQAAEDVIVSNDDQNTFFAQLAKTNPDSHKVSIPAARHEIFFEQDNARNLALKTVNDFFAACSSK